MYSKKTVKFVQILFYPLFHSFFKLFYNPILTINSNLKKEDKYIFVPNHPSRIDPFYIFYMLPFRELIKLLPLRFLTAKEYLNTPIKRFFLGIFGCYPADNNSLNKSIEFLNKLENPCLFIQGKLDKNYSNKPKIGPIYLEREVRESYLVPVRIEFDKGLRAKITFMNKFRHDKFPKDLQPLAEDLLKSIKNGTEKFI